MTKSQAAKAFLELTAQLQHEGLLSETNPVRAALRGDDGAIFFAELSGADMTMQETQAASQVPLMGRWHYSRAEMIADGVVHAVGIVLAIAAGSAMRPIAGRSLRTALIVRR